MITPEEQIKHCLETALTQIDLSNLYKTSLLLENIEAIKTAIMKGQE